MLYLKAVNMCHKLSCGSIIGASIDFGTRDMKGKRAYQIPLCICLVVPTIQSIALIFTPESPRWLMVQGRDTDAENSLRKLRNSIIDEHQLQAELNEIRESTKEQVYQNKGYLFFEMWRGTNLRRSILSICTVSLHSANGMAASPISF